MEKTARTYRFSEEVIDKIEKRDKEKYPTAVEFIETKILMPQDSAKELLARILRELQEVEHILEAEKNPYASKTNDDFF